MELTDFFNLMKMLFQKVKLFYIIPALGIQHNFLDKYSIQSLNVYFIYMSLKNEKLFFCS